VLSNTGPSRQSFAAIPRNDLSAPGVAQSSPTLHRLAALIKQVATPLGRFGPILDHKGKHVRAVKIGWLTDSGLALAQGDNVANGRGGRVAVRRPLSHQPPALFQKRAASICGLDLVRDRMR